MASEIVFLADGSHAERLGWGGGGTVSVRIVAKDFTVVGCLVYGIGWDFGLGFRLSNPSQKLDLNQPSKRCKFV